MSRFNGAKALFMLAIIAAVVALLWVCWYLPGWLDIYVAGWGFIIGVVLDIFIIIPIIIMLVFISIIAIGA